MNAPLQPVERLFPFALRARIVVPGREAMARQQRRLLFVLITTDLSPKSRERIRFDFGQVPIIERYTSAEVEALFAFRGAKVLGFRRSSLAQALLKELKAFKLPPLPPPEKPATPNAIVTPAPKLARTAPEAVPEQPAAPETTAAAAVLPAPTVELGWRARRRLQKAGRAASRVKTSPPSPA
jgi:hypothetical protein